MSSDPISDFLIQLKNASRAKQEYVVVPFSNLKMGIATILEREGYLSAVAKKGKKVKKYLYCEIAYDDHRPRIHEVKRISRPSQRVYIKNGESRMAKQNQGLAIISTPRGLLTDKEARKEKVGGELLFSLW